MISWREDKLRWLLFYYLIGLIVGCLCLFIEESLFPLALRYLHKSLFLFFVAPGITILVSIILAVRRR